MSRIKIYTLEIIYPQGHFAPLKKPELKLIPHADSRLGAGYAKKVWRAVQDENYHILTLDNRIKYTDINPNRRYKFQGEGVSAKTLFAKLGLTYKSDQIFAESYKRLDKITAKGRRLQSQASRLFAQAEATHRRILQLGGRQILEPEKGPAAGYFHDRDHHSPKQVKAARLAEVYYDQLSQAEQLESQAASLEAEYKY